MARTRCPRCGASESDGRPHDRTVYTEVCSSCSPAPRASVGPGVVQVADETKAEVDARIVLETIAGDRCPCGHVAGDHRPSRTSGGLPEGMLRVLGSCRLCDCQGLIDATEEVTTDAA